MTHRKRLRGVYEFRHFGENYKPEKPGLYLNNFMAIKDRHFIPDKEVVEIRDWLTRYINDHLLKTTSPNIVDMKTKSRAILKGLEKLEAQQ